jgi:hypothetical protein
VGLANNEELSDREFAAQVLARQLVDPRESAKILEL